MKKVFMCVVGLFCTLFLASCGEEQSQEISLFYSPFDCFRVNMLVTNDEGDDLVLLSSRYSTANQQETFLFDTWEAYLDGELVQSAEAEWSDAQKRVNSVKEDQTEWKSINMDTSKKVEYSLQFTNSYYKPHTIELVFSSTALLGDSRKHTLKIDYWYVYDEKTTRGSFARYSVFFDGEEQELFYPRKWEEGQEPYAEEIDLQYPCFAWNIDK